MRWLFLLLGGLGCVWTGCTATPLPEAPFEGDFEFEPGTGSVPFTAIAGSIDPDHVLRIWELDTNAPPQNLAPNPDGSITGMLTALATRVRLEVRDRGGRRSLPLDLNVPSGGRLMLAECIDVATQLEVEEGVPELLELRNDCPMPVEVVMRTRVIAPITLPTEPVSLATGESTTFEITATSTTDEIVFINVLDQDRPLTVFTR